MRSSWGSWSCSAWRKGGYGETLLFSSTTWEDVVARRVLVSSARQPLIGWEDMASSCTRGDSYWTSEIIFSLEGWLSVWTEIAQGSAGLITTGTVQHLDVTLNAMVWLTWWCLVQGLVLDIFSNPNASMSLYVEVHKQSYSLTLCGICLAMTGNRWWFNSIKS